MPYSSNPQYSTYKTVAIPFNGVETFRSGDLTSVRDLQIVNAYYDRVSMENEKRTVALKKRPGMAVTTYNMTKNATSDAIRGYHNDSAQNAFYWAVNNHLYYLKPDTSIVPTLIATLNTSSGYVGFTGFLKSTNTRYVCISDGTDLWVHDYIGGVCNRVVDADMPTPHQPYPVYLDGYIFLIKSSTGDLYNSDVDDPTSWTAGGFISCEMNNDYALRPIRLKNYIGVFGSKSVEYFYDNSNTAPSSPMSRYDSAYNSIGYVTGGCQIADTFYFIGQDSGKNLAVYQVNSFKIERISNAIVDSTIQTTSSSVNAKGQVSLNKDSHCIAVDGHNFLVIPTTQTTWVYDIDEKFWFEWKGSDGLGLAVEASWNMYNGSCYVAIANQTYISVMAPALYQDFGSNYTMRYTTDQFTADSLNWKFGFRLLVIADQDQSGSASSTITVTWSDDDWAAGTDDGTGISRSLQLFSDSPYIRGLGRFRQRSFRFEYADNYPLRITAVMVDVNVGIV